LNKNLKIALMTNTNHKYVYFFPTVSVKYNAATPNMHSDPKIEATLGHRMITIIGGLKNK
jgi:hypothetical protein